MYFILQISGIHPTKCDPHFKQIVHCMADGRNHVPCCERNQVPDICQDMCIVMKISYFQNDKSKLNLYTLFFSVLLGDYTFQTDDVRTHLSCGAYTAPTLACIAEGIGKSLTQFHKTM